MSWVDYWNGKPTIYVNDRHREAHDFDIAFSIVRHLPSSRPHVLDFGCGEATRARYIANRCAKLYLWDAASSVRDRLNHRFGSNSDIVVLDHHGIKDLGDRTIDFIVVSSVVQYMTQRELIDALLEFRRLLATGGRLVIADVIPPSTGVFKDTWQLFRFARQERFLPAAISGLVRTAASGYLVKRSKMRLTKFHEKELLKLLASCGFVGSRVDRNFGHNQLRMAFEAYLPLISNEAASSDSALEHAQ